MVCVLGGRGRGKLFAASGRQEARVLKEGRETSVYKGSRT